MITATTYIRPNITIEYELIGLKKFYVYNYKGSIIGFLIH